MPPADQAPPAGQTRRAKHAPRTLATHVLPPEAFVVVIGQSTDIHRALTHPAVESGRFSVVQTHLVDVEVGLHDESMRLIEQLIERGDADTLLLAGPIGPSGSAWATDLAIAHGIPLWAVMPTEVAAAADPQVVWQGDEPLLELAGQRKARLALGVKRGVDIAGALVGIVVTAPFILGLSVLIRLESKGWPWFRHTRVARGGRPFGCLKLRTMHVDAERQLEADGMLFEEYLANNYKIPEDKDPRVTRLGRLLRRSSLDEIPQFWNVLAGDMSLVGARPVVPSELEHYQGARRRLLLSMRPGLTGAWAVSGRHAVGYPERAEVELEYVRSWSLRQDAMVLLRTLRAVLSY